MEKLIETQATVHSCANSVLYHAYTSFIRNYYKLNTEFSISEAKKLIEEKGLVPCASSVCIDCRIPM